MSYLIIFEEVPESIRLYYVKPTPEEAKKLEACHCKYINGEEWPEAEWLMPWLENKNPMHDSGLGVWNEPQMLPAESCRIIITGFLL